MGTTAENYLVRIYRRDMREPRRVAGLVEIIEEERTEAFKNAEELMHILGIGSGSVGDRLSNKGG